VCFGSTFALRFLFAPPNFLMSPETAGLVWVRRSVVGRSGRVREAGLQARLRWRQAPAQRPLFGMWNPVVSLNGSRWILTTVIHLCLSKASLLTENALQPGRGMDHNNGNFKVTRMLLSHRRKSVCHAVFIQNSGAASDWKRFRRAGASRALAKKIFRIQLPGDRNGLSTPEFGGIGSCKETRERLANCHSEPFAVPQYPTRLPPLFVPNATARTARHRAACCLA
jgi:hypothetical protein